MRDITGETQRPRSGCGDCHGYGFRYHTSAKFGDRCETCGGSGWAPTSDVGDLPRVTVELDSGPLTMTFAYVPIGRPAYSDVLPEVGEFWTEADAETAGARMLAVGNWTSFRVEKRYAQAALSASSERLPGDGP